MSAAAVTVIPCSTNSVGSVCGLIVMVNSEETLAGMLIMAAAPSEESKCAERKVPLESMVTVAVALEGAMVCRYRADAVHTVKLMRMRR